MTSVSNIIIIILLIILIFIVLLFTLRTSKRLNRACYQSSDNKTVVLLKTHLWTSDLEKFANKLRNETLIYGIDFFILVHCEDPELFNRIQNKELKQHVLMFRETDIQKIYKKGFYGMWLSNHWILMWFFKKYGDKYQYYWNVEYDVRISGDSSRLWTYQENFDFVYPVQPFQNRNWKYKNYYVGKMTDDDKYYGYLQLARFSRPFLNYLDKHFQSGENGQDELIIFSLFKRGKFKGSHQLLANMINNSWTVSPDDSEKHKKLFRDDELNSIHIYHPIK